MYVITRKYTGTELAWEVLAPGWRWKSGNWTIQRRVTERGTRFLVFYGDCPLEEEVASTVNAAKEFVWTEAIDGRYP